jgi:hypothetical protein
VIMLIFFGRGCRELALSSTIQNRYGGSNGQPRENEA